MGNKLNVNQPCAVVVKGAQLHPVLAGVHLMEVSLRVCWTLGRPCLQCGVLFQAFSTRKILAYWIKISQGLLRWSRTGVFGV